MSEPETTAPEPPRLAERSVYLVTHGTYSNYEVLAVFSTREAADAYVALPRFYSDARVEVFRLDDPDASTHYGAWVAGINARGDLTDPPEWVNGQDPRAAAQGPFGNAHPDRNEYLGYGPTPEHARRSAEGLRRATLAGTVVPGGS